MAYKVDYKLFAILSDGTAGNVLQSTGTMYTNAEVAEIEPLINQWYKDRKRERVCEIISIERIKGSVIEVKDKED